jgi:hypothetical protein
VILLDDSGQIDSYENRNLISFSEATFMVPVRFLEIPVESNEMILVLYIINLVVLTILIFLLSEGLKIIKFRIKK